MLTLTLQQPGQFHASDQPAPTPDQLQTGEALVRIHRIGICGTDLHAYRGKQPFFTYPRILGHELGVEIIALQHDPSSLAQTSHPLQIGDRCSVEPYLSCGKCIACRRARPNCCVNMQVLGVHTDGGMRPFIRIPISKLHRSDKLSLDQLALVETLGIGAHAVDRAQLTPGEHVLVIGAGPIGLSVIQFARAAGAHVIVHDLSASRLAFVKQHLPSCQTISSSEVTDTLRELTQGDLPTAVFDATGHPTSMAKSFELVAHSGKLIFVGLFQGDVTFHDPLFHKREMTLLATRNSTPNDFRRIIQLIEQGIIDTTPWITHRCTLDRLSETFPDFLEPSRGVIKAMVEVGQP